MLSPMLTKLSSRAFFEAVKKWGIFAAISVVLMGFLLFHQLSDQKFIRGVLMNELQESNRTRDTIEKTVEQNTRVLEGCAKLLESYLNDQKIHQAAQLE